MKKTARHSCSNVKEKHSSILTGAATYHGATSQLDAVATSIRRGLGQARKSQGRPADEVFDELEREGAG